MIGRLALLLVGAAFLSGCSIAIAKHEELGPGRYQVSAYGNVFSTEDDLQVKLKEEADEVCGIENYSFASSEYGRKQDWSSFAATGLAMSKGVAEAEVLCNEDAG